MMKQWSSFDEILDFAIKQEEEAAAFYRMLAGKAKSGDMKQALEEFAVEEDGHKAVLLNVKESGLPKPSDEKVTDLKIADYLVEVSPGEDMDYIKILILAMKREKAAFTLYTRLASRTDNPELKALLANLAQEEAKHKLRFEMEYDDFVYTEN
jgi:rubrerythrin